MRNAVRSATQFAIAALIAAALYASSEGTAADRIAAAVNYTYRVVVPL